MEKERWEHAIESLQRSIENAQLACSRAMEVIQQMRIEPEIALYDKRFKELIADLQGGNLDGK